MARFTYTAEKPGGETYKGVAEAADRFALYKVVRQEGGKIVSIKEDAVVGKWSLAAINNYFIRITEYEKILFARNLGAMLAAGLPLSRALSVIERQTKNAKLLGVVSVVASDVRHGKTLHEALAGYPNVFAPIFVAMVRAGEEGGDLPSSLQIIADQMERSYSLKKKIRGAMIYPSIIIVAIVAIGILMMIYVVPSLAATFKQANAPLPQSTQFVIDVSNFLVQYTVLAIGGLIGVVAIFYAGLRTRPGKLAAEFSLLHLPVVGDIVRQVNAARTSRTLSSLLSSGVDVITSLGIVADVVQNSFFRAVIKEAAEGVGRGETLSSAFVKHENLYPAFVGEMMAVGEETGQLSEMLKRLAAYYEDEVDRATKDMSTIIEPFLMIVIGIAVGFFAISMISPIYSLSNVIN